MKVMSLGLMALVLGLVTRLMCTGFRYLAGSRGASAFTVYPRSPHKIPHSRRG